MEGVELLWDGGQDRAAAMVGERKDAELFGNRQSKYREFVLEGIGKASVGEDLKGQIYLGSKDFLERMQNLVGRKVVRGIAKAQTTPLRPSVDDIVATIGRRYGMAASDVLDKRRPEAYWLAIFLMRRAANLSLREVADLAKVSPARISQIQSKIE
jgi:hypothetical protein